MLEINRRSLITGLVSFIAAPAIVRVSSIMPVRVMLATPLNLTATEVAARQQGAVELTWRLMDKSMADITLAALREIECP